jgi:hypothetical protein
MNESAGNERKRYLINNLYNRAKCHVSSRWYHLEDIKMAIRIDRTYIKYMFSLTFSKTHEIRKIMIAPDE